MICLRYILLSKVVNQTSQICYQNEQKNGMIFAIFFRQRINVYVFAGNYYFYLRAQQMWYVKINFFL